jgi:hypothetical protein
MRAALGIAGAAALGLGAVLLRPDPAAAVCSVFDKHPCAPTVCSVFRRGPCRPEFDPPIGQTLQLTIALAAGQQPAGDGHDDPKEKPKLNTIQDLFAALRACPVALPDVGRQGMQMTVQLSFKRNGEIIGTPRITFTTRSASAEVKDAYYQAITAALKSCAPLPFTDGLGGAIAGRPIAIRYIDNRMLESEHI